MPLAYDAMKSTTSGTDMKQAGSSSQEAGPGSRHCQFGVSSRSESQRSVRQELATSPRSRTTWSIERLVSRLLIAKPQWPASMPTVVVRMRAYRLSCTDDVRRSETDFDLNVGRVRDDVVH